MGPSLRNQGALPSELWVLGVWEGASPCLEWGPVTVQRAPDWEGETSCLTAESCGRGKGSHLTEQGAGHTGSVPCASGKLSHRGEEQVPSPRLWGP